MRDYNHLLVIAGFVVLLDIAFLIRGRRRRGTTENSEQISIPFEGERRGSGERRPPAVAGSS